MKTFKKFIFTLLMMISIVFVSGCGATELVDFVNTDLATQINNRANINKNAINILRDNGILTADEANTINNRITENVNALLSDSTTTGNVKVSVARLAKATKELVALSSKGTDYTDIISYYYNDSGDKVEVDLGQMSSSELAGYVISEYLAANCSAYYSDGENVGYPDNRKKYDPMEFIDDDTIKQINNLGNIDVYVLNTSIGEDLAVCIDEIQNTINSGNTQEISKVLKDKFMPLYDENNEKVKLLDENFELAGTSRIGGNNECGYLLDIEQFGMTVTRMGFKEIYLDNFEEFNRLIGAERGAYYFLKDKETNGWKAYLMEYPVNVLDTVSKAGNVYTLDFVNTENIRVNIKTGRTVVLDEKGEWKESTEDAFIKLGGDNRNSSLVINGKTRTDKLKLMNKNGDDIEVSADVPAIYLRDYIEYNYCPGYNENDLVSFGRRLRINEDIIVNSQAQNKVNTKEETSYGEKYIKRFVVNDTNQEVMYYIDNEGNKDTKYQSVTLSDIAHLHNDGDSVITWYFDSSQGADFEYISKEKESIKEIGDIRAIANPSDCNDKLKVGYEFVYNEETEYNKNDEDVFKIDTQDKISNCSHQMWGIITRWGIFDNGTFSWIQTSSSEYGVDWWNGYLEKNNLNYRINKDELEEYLSYNFASELGMNGIIIYDTKELIKIQELYDKEENRKYNSVVKTAFFILGFVLIIYAIVLIICWLIDIHATLTVKLYNKATFGVLEAAEDIDESMEKDAKKYVTMSGAIKISVTTAVLGVILMTVSALKIAKFILELFGAIAKGISEIF